MNHQFTDKKHKKYAKTVLIIKKNLLARVVVYTVRKNKAGKKIVLIITSNKLGIKLKLTKFSK